MNALRCHVGDSNVQVGQELVNSKQESRTQKEADDRWNPAPAGHFNRWRQQGPVAGGNHDAGGETKHAIQQTLVHLAGQKDARCPQCSHTPGEQGRKECLEDWMESLEKINHGVNSWSKIQVSFYPTFARGNP